MKVEAGKNQLRATITDLYEAYPNRYNLTAKVFRAIVETFNKLFIDAIIKTGYAFKLPSNLGIFGVKKYKSKFKLPMWDVYATDDIKVNYKNRHSEGWQARFFWDKRRIRSARLEFPAIWMLKIPRKATKALSEEIIQNNTITKYYTNV